MKIVGIFGTFMWWVSPWRIGKYLSLLTWSGALLLLIVKESKIVKLGMTWHLAHVSMNHLDVADKVCKWVMRLDQCWSSRMVECLQIEKVFVGYHTKNNSQKLYFKLRPQCRVERLQSCDWRFCKHKPFSTKTHGN